MDLSMDNGVEATDLAPTWVEAVIAPVNVRVKSRLSPEGLADPSSPTSPFSTRNSGSAVSAEVSALSERVSQIALERKISQITLQQAAVPLHHLEKAWRRRQNWHQFIIFFLCAGLWSLLQHHRIDAMFAHTTYRGYKIAEQALPEKYSEHTTTAELGRFLDRGLVQKVLSAMDDKGEDGVCPDCDVGVTSKAGDMRTLSLADFICSDFDSTVDNHEYPTRNCTAVDEEWAAAPTVLAAPCCTNNTLAFQSLVLTALNQDSGDSGSGETGSGASGSGDTQQLFKDWAMRQIHGASGESGLLIQLVVSRGERMVGVTFKADVLDEQWFTHVVESYQLIWSQRYDDPWNVVRSLFFLFAFIDAISDFYEIAMDIGVLRRIHGSTCGLRVVRAYLWRWETAYLFFIELPSIILPLIREMFHLGLSVNQNNLFIGIVFVILLVRFFEAGQVVPAFRLLVLIMKKATESLVHAYYVHHVGRLCGDTHHLLWRIH